MTLDIRSAKDEAKSEFLSVFTQYLEIAWRSTGCTIEQFSLATTTSAPMDASLQGILSAEAHSLQLSNIAIVSGAGHDSAHLSLFAPAAMIFIPCVDGLSHCAEEFTTSEAIAKGAAVITRSILHLAKKANFDFLKK